MLYIKGKAQYTCVVLGDLPEDETDESKEVGLSHSVNHDDSVEISKTKSSGIVLEPVSVASLHQQVYMGPHTYIG